MKSCKELIEELKRLHKAGYVKRDELCLLAADILLDNCGNTPPDGVEDYAVPVGGDAEPEETMSGWQALRNQLHNEFAVRVWDCVKERGLDVATCPDLDFIPF